MGIMYDAVTPANIPADAQEVAGYVDGLYKWTPEDWARFTHATLKLGITAIPFDLDADVCDCENGDYTPTQAAEWAKGRLARGKRPIIYCSLNTWNQVQWQLSVVGISAGQVDWWIAHYTGIEHLEPGSEATQFADPGPVDISETAPGWTGDQTPVAPPPPAPAPFIYHPAKDDDMDLITVLHDPADPSKGGEVFLADTTSKVYVPDAVTLNGLSSKHGAPVPVTKAFADQLVTVANGPKD